MFAYLVFFCFCLITSNVAADTNSTSSMTSDTCYTTGLWTIWFNITATRNPYPVLVQIANATCQSPLALEIDYDPYQSKSTNAGSSSTSSAWSELLDLLQRASQALSGRNFAVRFCCVVSSSNSSKTTTTRTTTKTTTTRTTKSTTKTVASNVTLTSLDGSVCGKQSITPSPGLTARIFGGTDAVAHSWPWVRNKKKERNRRFDISFFFAQFRWLFSIKSPNVNRRQNNPVCAILFVVVLLSVIIIFLLQLIA